MMIEEPPKETKHKAPNPKRKLKKKERKEYIKYKILTSRKPQNETTQMLTKERGGGRENWKEETEWLMSLAGYRYNVQAIGRWSINSQRHEDERSEEARREVRWVIWVICAITKHTLYGPSIHDEDHQLSFLWPSHWYSKSTDWREWVSGHYTVLKVYRPEESGSVETEWNSRTHRVDWDKTDMTVYGVDQWVWVTMTDS